MAGRRGFGNRGRIGVDRHDRYAFIVTFASHDFAALTAGPTGPVQAMARIWTYKRSNGSDKPAMAP